MAAGARVCSFALLILHTLVRVGSRKRSRAKPQSIDYNRIIHQSGPTNPPRSASIQKHLSKSKKPNWLFKLPFTPQGGEGAGGKRGTKS